MIFSESVCYNKLMPKSESLAEILARHTSFEITQSDRWGFTETEFWKFTPVEKFSAIGELALDKPKMKAFAKDGYCPKLLRKEKVDQHRIKTFWEIVPGESLRKTTDSAVFTKDGARAVADLFVAEYERQLYHSDSGAHNIIWAEPGSRFKPAVFIDVDDLVQVEEGEVDPTQYVVDFCLTMLQTWIGEGVLEVLIELVDEETLALFMPETYLHLLEEIEAVFSGTSEYDDPEKVYLGEGEEAILTMLEVKKVLAKIEPELLDFVLRGRQHATAPSIQELIAFFDLRPQE